MLCMDSALLRAAHFPRDASSEVTVSVSWWCVASQAFFTRLNRVDWFIAANASERLEVDVVDGQQRITTLILMYRVLQHQLNQLQPGHATVKALRKRFHVQSLVGEADILLLAHGGRSANEVKNELNIEDFAFNAKVGRCWHQ